MRCPAADGRRRCTWCAHAAGLPRPMKPTRPCLTSSVVRPGEAPDLGRRSTEETTAHWKGSSKKKYKEVAEADLQSFVDELDRGADLFWANDTHALLIVLQAMDAAGKDGTIRHVMSGVNPQGCEVDAFKQPTTTSSPTTSCGLPPRCSPNGA